MNKTVDMITIPLSVIIKNERNPRTISSSKLKQLELSIREFGLVTPIILNKNNEIIGGHQRYEVLVKEGVEELRGLVWGDIIIAFSTKELQLDSTTKEKALNIALNKISGDWDYVKLDKIFNENISNPSVELTGFSVDEIETISYMVDLNDLSMFAKKTTNREINFTKQDVVDLSKEVFSHDEDTKEAKKKDIFLESEKSPMINNEETKIVEMTKDYNLNTNSKSNLLRCGKLIIPISEKEEGFLSSLFSKYCEEKKKNEYFVRWLVQNVIEKNKIK